MDEFKKEFPWANEYQQYLHLRQAGLRKAAFAELDKFIAIFCDQQVATRRRFIDFAYGNSRDAQEYNSYLPVNLYDIFNIELHAWRMEEPENPIPYKWSADLSLLKKAVDLLPSDQLTLGMFFSRLTGRIEMNQHEVEFGFSYSGDPAQDLQLIIDAEPYLKYFQDVIKRETVNKCLLELKQVALEAIKK